MNRVLSLLMTYVFLQTQAWALSGGPFQNLNAGAATSVIGTYAGVLIPELKNRIFKNPSFKSSPTSDANTLGIFVMSVPEVGVATGNFLYFDEGEAYFGTLSGVADPDKLTITALLAGVAVGNGQGNGAGVIEFLTPINAVGKIEAEITGSVATFNSTGVRLAGSAFVQNQGFAPDTSPNGYGLTVVREITFVVDGFKQSDTASGTSIAAPSTSSVTPPTATP